MNLYHRPTWAEISLGAVWHNVREFRRVLPPNIKLMAVVKANAYGHGAVEVSREAMRAGAEWLGVAFMDEALQLRRAGVEAPILVMGYTPPDAVRIARDFNVAIAVYSEEVLEALAAAGGDGARPIAVHIKLDTGMGRIGLVGEREAIAFIDRALAIPGVRVEGLFTHYACADETDKSYTYAQHRLFRRIVDHYRSRGVIFDCLHAGNSATGIDMPELTGNMLRLGISMYGFYPSEEVRRTRVQLQPVMSLKTRIVMVKTLPPGSGVSYGAVYRTRGDEVIATIPIGYADGYSRMLSGRAQALVRGVRVPVVGRICMDQCMLDVTGVPGAAVGDEVILFGGNGEPAISADELARQLGTIHYEITCMVSARVPRVYLREDGTVDHVVNSVAANIYQ